MELSKAYEGFEICKTGNRVGDLSPATLKVYRSCINHLVEYLGDPCIGSITLPQLEAFMRYLEVDYKKQDGSNLSTYAQDNHWKAIRSIWKWSVSELRIKPVHEGLAQPVVVTEPVAPYTREDLTRILSALDTVTRTCRKTRGKYKQSRSTVLRDKAIIHLLLDTGMRIGELCRLKTEDLFMDYSQIKVKPYRSGKKSRPRDLPFGRNTKRWLWQYLTHTERLPKQSLFGITVSGLNNFFARVEVRSGVASVHAHRFRHTFAIEFLRNGGDVYSLQTILGHSDLTMCLRYLDIAKSDVVNAHRRASPVDNWEI
ncbi:MAG: site-specific integrase [Anaerolineaceae bacterium]|nr:site-specific integrase [Anaerolineaceae bacterium]